MGATGTLEPDGDTVTVRFDRPVRATPDEVFAALVDPPTVQRWLAACELEQVLGGKVRLVWPDGQGEMRGVVTAITPGRELEYSWNEGESDDDGSLLRLEIEQAEGGSTLRLIHSGTTPSDALGFGAGWQAHLEALDVVLSGADPAPGWGDARYEELRPLYEARFGQH
jgi:uncharacterized protein YndB with AHSA1/START domain